MTQTILKRFRINRLHGYKDIEIDFSSPARILIAGNGSGKTTIFNALHALLRCRFHRMHALDFHSIECEFTGEPKPIQLLKSQIAKPTTDPVDKATHLLARIPGLDVEETIEHLQTQYRIGHFQEQSQNDSIVRAIYLHLPGGYSEIGAAIDEIAAELRGMHSTHLSETAAVIRRALGGSEVVYLPTYRRIELPLLRSTKKGPTSRAAQQETIFSEESPDTKHINFGLADVEKRLNDLSESVERHSNSEYRNISATILDEALADQIQGSAAVEGLPDIESLRRFLSRVSQDTVEFPFRFAINRRSSTEKNERRISAIENLYNTNEIHSERQIFLRYFLSRLGTVIEKTKETEAMLQRFVDACNGYLSESADEKIFTYDPNATQVKVINSWTRQSIPLGNLSSGEKQIVSMLAHLYLNKKKKFVLIDEPELSLSIEWQKRILPDMLASGSISQLFAITHSPFIFDNSLDPCAGALRTERHEFSRGDSP
ncbi:AAA family ATPase [Myxococcus llanfairpwllgwyngyllgogerychwyrndrobwllllantysiliogogogochensis]|uniref:AAA family ATPase n=1 Tax=Myxococcus llanfairpwllgwyngyllgogerychwyrndrobwllllantysiliogogogochensis TaxID=2590453 RepID=A0A540X6V4_9BACT|nr:AAA family ATPase [Myxococcus llanfairpwllgwyngyllgogerychwyrndrobwllllantysiliogogogochensis]TQF17007.1 AAA family ATPase [Myxococcus llanfairpwllgwyngyllgogerychwyrndrobwllllantysiliogogogochensis]